MLWKSSSSRLLTVGTALLLSAAPLVAQDGADIPEVVRELLDAADRARQRGRLDEAAASYRQAIELAPQVVRAYTALGALYHQQGEREKALATFEAGLEKAPTEQALLTNAAAVALELGQAETALELAERAVATDPQNPDLRYLHGTVLRRLDRPEEAVATLQAGLNRRSNDPRLFFALGNAHQQLGQLEEAIAAYRGALKADRSYLPAQYNLGAVLFEAERFDEAQEAYQAALEPFDKALAKGETVDAVHGQAYLNLGAIFLRKEAWRPALDAYSKAARLLPESPVAQYHVGYTLYQLGDRDAAYRTYQAALELDPDLPIARLHVAQIEADRGRPTAVVEHLPDTVVDVLEGERQEDALRLVAEAHLALGEPAAAERAYRRLRQTRPEDPAVAVALGRLLRRQGRRDEARPLLEEALSTAPDSLAAGLELAALARDSGELETEKNLYLKVLETQGRRPELVSVRVNLALVLLQLGERQAARERLETLLPELRSARDRQAGRDGNAAEEAALRTAYALLLAQEGQLEEAEEQVRSVLREAPEAPARTALAALEAFSGQAESAVGLFEEQQRPSAASREALLLRANLGQALWLHGRPADARPHLEAAVAAYPRWLGPRVALGEIALAAGELNTAGELLEAAAALCAEPDTARNPLAGPQTDGGDGRDGGSGGSGRVFQLLVDGPRAPDALCERVERLLGVTATQEAYRGLTAGQAETARRLAARALAAPLDPPQQALAHFVRGSALLLLGRNEAARQDLSTALGGSLDPGLRPLAHNNLGVALQRQGRLDEARSQFEAARTGQTSPTAALLNLGIAAEARGEGAEALTLYRRYLAEAPRSGRRDEVQRWVEELTTIYPGEGP